ncbi:TPA: DUF551 domain-containing protein [Klebsiella pneumoniae]
MSEFSRETLLNIIETDHVQCGESSALARMALASMDSSESVELPLDYLQGHKDGLDWAAQLAESNHPQTGDWLYDDPIELAKAIRKGPDMTPAQPAPVVPGKWIPVSERMPDEAQPVIVVSEGGVVQRTVYQYCEGVWSDWYDMYDDVNVEAFTHWMPLPAAPQEVKGE